MLRAQIWRDLQLKLIETQKMRRRYFLLNMGRVRKFFITNPAWYILLVDKHDKKSLLRLKTQCLKFEKMNLKLNKPSLNDCVGPTKSQKSHEKSKIHVCNVRNKKLRKEGFCVTCTTGK